MSDINNLKRQLKIKTGAAKRLFKEKGLYQKEAEEMKRKLDKLRADGVPEDEWEVKNTARLCEESNKMIQDSSERLGSTVTELRQTIVAAKKEATLAKDTDLLAAEEILEAASI
ncbi:hypothetical protein E1B28_001624 [Marasmius oreades]|uniref:Tubulin-specific chaperone A n=1 Tax=Marasmius oreades TaxID=181124 RepID=A0A9P7V3X8_9AGAR|nr:uncharacterized protein E1B28_001624 [Marasmius oreades]KAG7099813.1 hypothetical protein E1B28_001624 [Marasmius oreades]